MYITSQIKENLLTNILGGYFLCILQIKKGKQILRKHLLIIEDH